MWKEHGSSRQLAAGWKVWLVARNPAAAAAAADGAWMSWSGWGSIVLGS